MQLFATTSSSTEANEPVQQAVKAKTNFRPQRKFYVSRGFRCSSKATDKPNVAVNTRQN